MRWNHSDKWEGKTGVLICSGPSMDVGEFPEAQFQLDIIEQAHAQGKIKVMTANDACYLAPFTDGIYAADRRWWDRHYNAIMGSQPRPFDNGQIQPSADEWYKFSATLYSKCAGTCESRLNIVRLVQDGTTGLTHRDGYIRHGGNSGYQALHTMYHLGCKRILITGLDCKNVTLNRTHRNHFFGNHPAGWGQANGTASWRNYFRTIAKPLKEAGVEVINIGLDTAIDAFTLGKIEDYL